MTTPEVGVGCTAGEALVALVYVTSFAVGDDAENVVSCVESEDARVESSPELPSVAARFESQLSGNKGACMKSLPWQKA